jgi:hypothetical protein
MTKSDVMDDMDDMDDTMSFDEVDESLLPSSTNTNTLLLITKDCDTNKFVFSTMTFEWYKKLAGIQNLSAAVFYNGVFSRDIPRFYLRVIKPGDIAEKYSLEDLGRLDFPHHALIVDGVPEELTNDDGATFRHFFEKEKLVVIYIQDQHVSPRSFKARDCRARQGSKN